MVEDYAIGPGDMVIPRGLTLRQMIDRALTYGVRLNDRFFPQVQYMTLVYIRILGKWKPSITFRICISNLFGLELFSGIHIRIELL